MPPATQLEVFNLLRTYQDLTADNIATEDFGFLRAKFPVDIGFHYHHAKIAVQGVQAEIQSVRIFSEECPGIASLLSGQVICDLSIVYANLQDFGRNRRRRLFVFVPPPCKLLITMNTTINIVSL